MWLRLRPRSAISAEVRREAVQKDGKWYMQTKYGDYTELVELLNGSNVGGVTVVTNPPAAPTMPIDRWLQLMRVDKKSEAGEIRFVLLDGVGRAVVRGAPHRMVEQVIRDRSAAR